MQAVKAATLTLFVLAALPGAVRAQAFCNGIGSEAPLAAILPVIPGLEVSDLKPVVIIASVWQPDKHYLFHVVSDFDLEGELSPADDLTESVLADMIRARRCEVVLPKAEYSEKFFPLPTSDDEAYFIRYRTGERYVLRIGF